MVNIREIMRSDLASVLELNEAEVSHTSELGMDGLLHLVRMSAYSRVATVEEKVAAFLIALREGAAYESENYRWFLSRFPTFLYVDRIVVASKFAGRKIGSRLYADLFTFAASEGIDTIACEYNMVPPNPASRAFHEKFGFEKVGRQWVANGTKRVSLQIAAIDESSIGRER